MHHFHARPDLQQVCAYRERPPTLSLFHICFWCVSVQRSQALLSCRSCRPPPKEEDEGRYELVGDLVRMKPHPPQVSRVSKLAAIPSAPRH